MARAEDSLPFDRAVGYYDRTRALPPEASKAVTGLLAAELRGRGPTLERVRTGPRAGIEEPDLRFSAPIQGP